MNPFKRTEIAFRRLLVQGLALMIKRNNPLPDDINFNGCKFLFVRQDRIGDVLVSTPLFHALKKHYPNVVVDVLLSTNNFFVLENDPAIRKRWVYTKNIFRDWKLLRNIRRERYDFVIDLMDNPSATSTVFSALAGGTWNVGLSKENAYVYDIPVPLLSRKETHIVDRLAQLLKVFRIGIPKEQLRIRYYTLQESEQFTAQFWEKNNLDQQFVVGLNVSPGKGARFWGVNNFQNLIRTLLEQFPSIPIVILFEPSDRPIAESIARPFPNVLLSPETTSFDHFAALVRKLSLLVTPDTSAVHVAAAFQIPAVVLYVQSNKDLRIWEPYNTECEVLVTDVDDLTTIAVSSVFSAVQRLMRRISKLHPTTSNSFVWQS